VSDLSARCSLRLTKPRCREVVQETLQTFQQKFAHVFFCPGNHDLWCTGDGDGAMDSLHKLQQLEALCSQLGVHTGTP
jgi:UDP-2,3-diacylglucosamine pyrophosphatase LpxH